MLGGRGLAPPGWQVRFGDMSFAVNWEAAISGKEVQFASQGHGLPQVTIGSNLPA